MQEYENDTFLNLPATAAATGLPAAAIIQLTKTGAFPEPCEVAGDEVWFGSGIADWLQDQLLSQDTGEAA